MYILFGILDPHRSEYGNSIVAGSGAWAVYETTAPLIEDPKLRDAVKQEGAILTNPPTDTNKEEEHFSDFEIEDE